MAKPSELPQIFSDIQSRHPAFEPDVLLDVGANVGQTSLEFAQLFPGARILAVEPVPEAFAQLKAATQDRPNIRALQMALGGKAGRLTMTARGTSTMNRVVTGLPDPKVPVVEVAVQTGASLMRNEGLERVAYLKIDAEGYDLEVVRGFGPSLRRADFIQVEAGMNPYNRSHVGFRLLDTAMRRRGFLLFGIYDQTFEFRKGGRPVLRRANLIYINGRLVDLEGIS
jgi:FkbM family methyltransferase